MRVFLKENRAFVRSFGIVIGMLAIIALIALLFNEVSPGAILI